MKMKETLSFLVLAFSVCLLSAVVVHAEPRPAPPDVVEDGPAQEVGMLFEEPTCKAEMKAASPAESFAATCSGPGCGFCTDDCSRCLLGRRCASGAQCTHIALC